MRTSSQHRIEAYTAKGWWGIDTLHSLLADTAKAFPDKIAVADQPNRIELIGTDAIRLDYKGLEHASELLAQQLIENGIKHDDILIVQMPNIVELVVTYYAASKIGAVISPVPVQFARHELSTISHALGSKLFITTATFKEQYLAKEALELGMQVLSFGEQLPQGVVSLSLTNATVESALAFSQYKESNKGLIDDANRIISICWTSGTTGRPKGVPRSHNMWLATTKTEIELCDYRIGDNLLNPFPLVNMAAIGGFLFPAVATASSLFLHHPLDPVVYLQQLQQEQITFTIAPPALLNQLAKSADMWDQFDFSKLRRIGSGSVPLAPSMIETFDTDYAIEITNFYGSNEGICLVSTKEICPNPAERALMFPRLGNHTFSWQGRAFDFTNTKVVDLSSGQEITDPGISGELLISGATMFDCYFTQEGAETVEPEAFTQDGFFRTGDVVEICGHDANFYRIVGRCKDIINRGGMKISPVEIDTLLESMANIKEVAVCSYPDERLEEKICACVVPQDLENIPSLQQICEHLMVNGLAKFKWPERIEVFDQLPRNPMGKVLRYQLKEKVGN